MVWSIPAAAASVEVSGLGDSISSASVPSSVALSHCDSVIAPTPDGPDARTAPKTTAVNAADTLDATVPLPAGAAAAAVDGALVVTDDGGEGPRKDEPPAVAVAAAAPGAGRSDHDDDGDDDSVVAVTVAVAVALVPADSAAAAAATADGEGVGAAACCS